jgi:hypothetical protein
MRITASSGGPNGFLFCFTSSSSEPYRIYQSLKDLSLLGRPHKQYINKQ